MHTDTESKRLLSVLRERPVSVDPAREEARRERAVPLLEARVLEVSRRHARRRSRWFALGSLAAIVAVIAAVMGVRTVARVPAATAALRAVDGHVTHDVDGSERIISPGDSLALPIGGEVRTDGTSEATLETSRGLRLHLESGSRLGLSGLAANGLAGSVHLEQGLVQCAVPKLEAGAHFTVVTPNARVVVHGTRFSVRVESVEAGVTRTCVRVTEGVVAVEQPSASAMLYAGDEWGCGSPPPAMEAPEPTVKPTVRRARPIPSTRTQGTLAEETALLQTALAAERHGFTGAASVAAARLVARYPDSPLLPEARAVLDRAAQKSEDR